MNYLIVLLICLSVITTPAFSAADEVPIGGVLRETPMQGLTGHSVMLSEYYGKPLIINVWASYCSPCLAEMGSLERLWQRYGAQMNIIGVSIDDYPENARLFLDKAGTSFPHYIDHQLTLEKMFGGNTIPLTLLIDDKGRVLEKVRGALQWDHPDIIQEVGQAFDMTM